jgi:hypothetical protein
MLRGWRGDHDRIHIIGLDSGCIAAVGIGPAQPSTEVRGAGTVAAGKAEADVTE